MAPAAFFSYSRDDSEFTLRLAEDLKSAGAVVWLDQRDVHPGERWDRAVEAALTSCERMLLILSPSSVNSVNVMDEVSFALEENKAIIPVLYRDCVIPFRLRRVQYIDFRKDYDRGFNQLLMTLVPPELSDTLVKRATILTQTADGELQQEGDREAVGRHIGSAPEREQRSRKVPASHQLAFWGGMSLHWFLNAAVLLIVAVFVPGFYVPRLWAGLTVVMVIGLSNAGLGFLLEKIGLRLATPALVAISFVLNVLILKLASAILPGFYVRTLAAALIGAFALAFIQMCFALFESRTNKQKALV